MKITIADALFKIVIKESGKRNRPDVLAFVYPQTGSKYRKGPFDHTAFLTSVHHIEELTGLAFLTALPPMTKTRPRILLQMSCGKRALTERIQATGGNHAHNTQLR